MKETVLNDLSNGSKIKTFEPYQASTPENVEMRFVDPLADSEWDQLVLSHPDVTFFHSTAWARVLAKSYGHKPFYFHLSRGGRPLACVPIMEVKSGFTGCRGVCLPFSDYCSSLLFNDCEPSVVVTRLSLLAKERRWKHFEVRGGNGFELLADPAVEYRGHVLDLRHSAESLFNRLSSSVRRAIRKAEKSKLSLEVSRSRESVMEFYRLHVRTRRRHGLPPQPLSFFSNIFDEIMQKGFGFVVRASLGSRSVAAAVFLQFGRTAIYKFGASESAARKVRGNNLVMWEGIRYLAHRGCESLHLGRTSPADAGLRRFKLGWGAAEEQIRYFKWNTGTGGWIGDSEHKRGLHNAFFARMPLAINRLGGAILYPHLD